MSYLANDLIEECEKADNPDTTFSPELIMKLETLSLAEKQKVVNDKSSSSHCAPLFIACRKGLLKICEFLINICNADIEQRGLVTMELGDKSTAQYNVCPLWRAASTGDFLIVKLLVSKGANVNALSDDGSTPVLSACVESHIDIVKYLAENGADLSIRNYEGVTCLMSSYRSIECQNFLLEHGVDINAINNRNRTALHFAIMGDNIKTVKFLIENGANPHIHDKNGHDALQLACVRGKKDIFDYLVKKCKYTNDREADALELIGSTLSQKCEVGKILAKMYWKFAARLRSKHNIFPKQYSARTNNNTILENAAKIVYDNIREFSTEQEVTNMDSNNMRIQALLIRDRILGPYHRDTLVSLGHLTEYYFKNGEFQRALEVSLYGLQAAVTNDLFEIDIFFILSNVRLIRVIHLAETSGDTADIWFVDLLAFAKIIVNELCNYQTLLSIKPVLESQMRNFDLILFFLVHLFHVLIEIAKTPDHIEYLKECVKKAVDYDPRSSKEDSLLHLAIYKSDMSDINAESNGTFPSLSVTKFLIECGANINAKNCSNSTPLHYVSHPDFYFPEIAQYLLDCGAHDDLVNNKGYTTFQPLSTNPDNIILLNVPPLKCLAIAAVGKNKIPYSGLIPEKLEEFVNFHNLNPDKNSPVEDLSGNTLFSIEI